MLFSVKDISWSFLDTVFTKFLNLLLFMVAARILGPEAFGILIVARLFVDYADNLSIQGTGTAIIQMKKLDQSMINTIFSLNVVIAFVLASLLFIFSDLIASFFDDSRVETTIEFLSCVVFIQAIYRVKLSLLMRDKKFKEVAIINVLSTTLSVSLALLMLSFDFGLNSLIVQQIIFSVTSLVMVSYISTQAVNLSLSKNDFQMLFSFTFPVFLDSQLKFFSRRFDEILIASTLSVDSVGVYGIIKKVLYMLGLVLYFPISKVALVEFSKIQADINLLLASLVKLMKLSVFLIAPFFLMISANPKLLVDLIGDGIIGAPEHWLSVTLLFGLGWLCLFQYFNHSAYLSISKPIIPLFINSARLISGIFLFYWFVPSDLIEYSMLIVSIDLFVIFTAEFYFMKRFFELESGIAFQMFLSLIPIIITWLSYYFTSQVLDYAGLDGLLNSVIYLLSCCAISFFIAMLVREYRAYVLAFILDKFHFTWREL